MTDLAPSPVPTPAPTPSPTPAPSPQAAVTVSRPEFIPENFWDGTANSLKPEFGQHYADLTNLKQTVDARNALIPAKPEDYQIGELKLPDTVKVPEGFEVKIDAQDPRLGPARSLAKELGLDQTQFNRLLAFDAELNIARHTSETARVTEQDKLLGDNAKVRKEAVGNWLKGLKDNATLSPDEYEAMRVYAVDAATVTALEKLQAKVAGAVPGGGAGTPPAPPKPADVPIEQRWYGNPQKAG